jgi:hypothetical protein
MEGEAAECAVEGRPDLALVCVERMGTGRREIYLGKKEEK